MLARGPMARKATLPNKPTQQEETKSKIKPDIFVADEDEDDDEEGFDPFKAAEKQGRRERANAQL